METANKVSKSVGILYISRGIAKQALSKQSCFCFIHCHLNYANITWESTHKAKLEGHYCYQKHAPGIINFNDRFIDVQPLLHDIKALKIFQINLVHIIYFMFKCKKKIAALIFYSFFTLKLENKYNIQSREKLAQPFYRKMYPV